MVHLSSLRCKDLTLRHFVVPSTNVRRVRVINWKSICIVLCCCVQFVEICTEQGAFVDGIIFLFSFEENCSWTVLITSRSLWWTCSIARHLWTIVSAFQKWWLRQKTKRKTTYMKNRQKKRRCRIANIVGRRWFANTKI